MFAKTIIDSDAFLDMPLSAQALYFHLSMRADDDGFINNPKKIQRMVGAADDDLKLLLLKRFVIGFESGVVVIKHWKIHNYIQKDRYKPTIYKEEMARLTEKKNRAYTDRPTECIQAVSSMDTQDRLGKVRLEVELEEDIKAPADEPPTPTPAPAPAEKAKPVKAIDFGSLSPRMILAVEKWLQYKKERRESYKPTGLQALISQIENNVALYGEDAVIDLIGKCMAAGWRGIIFDKLKNQPQAQRSQSGFDTSNPFLEMLNERRGAE